MSDKDLHGKVIVITGATSGLGLVAAKDFARRGAELVLLGRSAERLDDARKAVLAGADSPQVHVFTADFSSLQAVSAMADSLLQKLSRLDVFCSNAGGAHGSRQLTSEGFERTLVTNHLSAYLLTRRLLPLLLKTAAEAPVRVVFTSSYGHNNSPIDFDNLNLDQGFSTLRAYGRTKLMNLLTAKELHRRFGEQGLIASSFHPGAVRTSIWRKGGPVANLLGLVLYPFMRSEEQGAETMIWLATADDELACHADGRYFIDRQLAATASFATDEAASRLWTVSEDLVGDWLPEPPGGTDLA